MATISKTLASRVKTFSIYCLTVWTLFCGGVVAVTFNRAEAGASENGLIYYMGCAKSLQESERKDQLQQFQYTEDSETKQESPLAFNNGTGN